MSQTASPKILFAAYGGGHIAMLAPVIRAMADRGVHTRTLALTTAQAYLTQRDISHFGYSDLPEAESPAAQRYGRELMTDQSTASGPVSYEESVAYHGVNFLELVETHGETKAHELYGRRKRQAFLPVQTMIRLLQRERPDLIVVTNSPRTEQALAMAGKALGIPVVCMVDLFELHGLAKQEYAGYADKFLVLNAEVRRSFIAYGCTPEQVVATGNPAFDGLQRAQASVDGDRLRAERGWPAEEKIILWASQVEPLRHPFNETPGDPSLPRRIEQELRNFVASHDGVRLLVRYHPSERVIFVSGPRTEFSPTNEDLGTLLHAVDIVVVMTSTVGLQAAIVGKPVISVDTSVLFPDAPFSRMGISRGVANLHDLSLNLLEIINGPVDCRPSVANMPKVGLATDKVCEELHSAL